MLAVEHPRGDTFFGQHYCLDDSTEIMDFNNIPHYQQQQSWFVDHQIDMKPQITRTTSTNSVYQHEYAPGLTASSGSVRSGTSSAVGSPFSGAAVSYSQDDGYHYDQTMTMVPTIVNNDTYNFNEFGSDMPMFAKSNGAFVDPAMIGGYPEQQLYPSPSYNHISPMASPAPSPHFYNAQFSQPMTHDSYMQPNYQYMARQPSHGSHYSPNLAQGSPSSDYEDGAERRCPWPECGKVFKDLRAHMLTHQSERPEKCPITTCEYHKKGFARKYDKNRHTLTHYKGTMVCGFCPGAGTPSEKTFNRADVFKRHLCSVHGVEQAPPNSRRRTPSQSAKKRESFGPDISAKCSTCDNLFESAQELYEHLDECVMRVVQQEEPTEAINEKHLASVMTDKEVQQTFDRHMIKTEEESIDLELDEDEEEDDDDEEEAVNRATKKPKSAVLHGGIRKKGFTWSQGGVKPATTKRKQRKSNYPPSWGMSPDRTVMKKRVLVCNDGERMLMKDEMMLNRDHEVRIPLADGAYVTDLDKVTLERADAIHGATEEERGPWDGYTSVGDCDLEELMS